MRGLAAPFLADVFDLGGFFDPTVACVVTPAGMAPEARSASGDLSGGLRLLW
jgi:hypothetical protein